MPTNAENDTGGQVVAGSNPVSPTDRNGIWPAVMRRLTDQDHATRSWRPFWDRYKNRYSNPQRLRPPRWTSQMVNATEATTTTLSRTAVVIALIYRRARSKRSSSSSRPDDSTARHHARGSNGARLRVAGVRSRWCRGRAWCRSVTVRPHRASHPALALLLPTKCPDLAREKASLLVVEFLVRQEP
jgi:hypothetical protein